MTPVKREEKAECSDDPPKSEILEEKAKEKQAGKGYVRLDSNLLARSSRPEG